MLRKHLYYIVCLLLNFSFYINVNAQTSIKNFEVQQSGKTVKVSFIVDSQQYCTGYEIQRSANPETDFLTIYNYPAICGDNPEVKSIVYFDKYPIKNTESYYRIHIPPSLFSEVLSIIYYESPEAGYILYSNPVNETFKIKLNASGAKLELFTVNGRKLLEFTADQDGLIRENIQTLPNGIYYFLIKIQNNYTLRGKFAKSH